MPQSPVTTLALEHSKNEIIIHKREGEEVNLKKTNASKHQKQYLQRKTQIPKRAQKLRLS